MVFKKKTKRSPRRRWFKGKRKRKPKTVPMEMLASGIATLVVPGKENYFAPINHIQSGNFQGVGLNYLAGFTGIDADGGKFNFDLMKTINPFDFSTARYWKMLLWSGLIGKVRKKIVPQSSQLFRKIPFIGRWVS
jgi:hypothetical protein